MGKNKMALGKGACGRGIISTWESVRLPKNTQPHFHVGIPSRRNTLIHFLINHFLMKIACTGHLQKVSYKKACNEMTENRPSKFLMKSLFRNFPTVQWLHHDESLEIPFHVGIPFMCTCSWHDVMHGTQTDKQTRRDETRGTPRKNMKFGAS